MSKITPRSPDELAAALRDSAAARKTIRIEGNNSKHRAGGATPPADVTISTSALDQVLEYEPKDLTISVGAGMPYARFHEMLDRDGMMVPIDPPFAGQATIGGVIAANSSGPRRRLYGTPRDLVIGMKFATMEGKVVQSGGMVVKNVAGLDMGKLLIGSLGTLAAIASINFKLIPKPFGTRTFLYEFPTAQEAIAVRDRTLQGVMTPVAVDLLNPTAAAGFGRRGWLLAIGTNGNQAVLDRYKTEFARAETLDQEDERRLWDYIQEFPSRFLESNPAAAIVRISTTLSNVAACVDKLPGAVIARAANGVCYSFISEADDAKLAFQTGRGVMEYGPESRDKSIDMWPDPDSGFPVMLKIKQLFDPDNLLNSGRLYGRI